MLPQATTLSSQQREEDDMSMPDPGLQATSATGPASRPATEPLEGANWVLFAGIMLMLMAILNVIWGIAAIDNSSFFVNDTNYILSSLNTWGWVALGIAALQAIAAFSIWKGGLFGVWFGIAAAGINAISALMAIPSYPFWSLAIFAIDIMIIYGLAAYGGQRRPV
jgi:hypothetical protein